MPLPRFHYSKNWENAADFPTHEYSEAQVRKDLMSLFTEWETYLNQTLLPVLESGGSGTGTGTGTGTGSGSGSDFLPLSGGQMTGPLLLAQNPVHSTEAATKQYVDDTGGLIQQGVDDAIAAITVDLGRVQAIVADGNGNIAQLTLTPEKIEAIVQNALGDLASLLLQADRIRALVTNAIGDAAQLSLTAEQIEAAVTDALGNLSSIIMNAAAVRALVRDMAGNAAALSMTPEEIQALVEDNAGNFTQIIQSSTEIQQAAADALGNCTQLSLTAEGAAALAQDILGNAASITLTPEEIRGLVKSELNREALLELVSDRITAAVRDAVSQAALSMTPGEIQALVQDAVSGSISSLTQTASALTAIVAGPGGDLSSVEQTAGGIVQRVQNAEGSLSTLSQTADSVTARISSAEGSLSSLNMTAASINAAVTDLNGRSSSLEQKLDSIRLSVSRETDGNTVYSRITLSIGPNNYVGRIQMEGNVDISGELSAMALYAQRGEVADLAVDKLTTSRRIVKYLAQDTSDDCFIRIQGQTLEFVAGIYQADSPVQAAAPDGSPLYWEADVSGADLGADGYPVAAGTRIFTTATVTSWPVYIYHYVEQVKRAIRFELGENGIYTPIDVYGAGNDRGYNKAIVEKGTEGFDLRYVTPNGGSVGIRMTTDGFVDITGIRRTAALNFSSWDNGAFTEALEGGQGRAYSVSFDENGNPVAITETASGFTLHITW